jgi:hypothetical protein
MRRDIQHGVRCPQCGDELYSNGIRDYSECACESIWVDGGMTPRYGTHAHGLIDPVPIEREVDHRSLPVRYRLEQGKVN